MKILKVKLKNFKSIDICMNCKEIEIDFTKMKTKICLFIGPNGSGKTSVLSLLTPFASLGNLDVRDSSPLIIEGKDGYKEIEIKNGDILYTIKHFYTHHDKTHSLKSYIEKDGVELNPNGNVTSFKEYVKEELGIELPYLKLLRLGDNVNTLIKMSETERKNYMGKILDDIGVFLTYYKKVNNDLRQLKEMISHDVDKLNRLGIENKEEIETKIKEVQEDISSLNKNHDKLTGSISVIYHDLDSIEDSITLKDRLHESEKTLSKMEKILSKKDELKSTDPEYYAKLLEKEKEAIIKLTSEKDATVLIIKNNLNRIDDLQAQYHTLEIQYEKEENHDQELRNMQKYLNELDEKIKKKKEILEGFEPSFTKAELEGFIVFLKNTQQTLNTTYEFGKGPVQKVIALMRDDKNVINYVNKNLLNISEYSSDQNAFFINELKRRLDLTKDANEFCDNTCEAKKLWVQVKNILETNEDTEKTKHTAEFYHQVEYAFQNIKNVMTSFAPYASIIKDLPKKIKESFLVESLYTAIENTSRIYNERDVNDLLSLVTEYDGLIKLEDEHERVTSNIAKSKELSNLSYITTQKETVESSLTSLIEKNHDYKNRIHDIDIELSELERDIESHTDLKETFEKHDEIKIKTEALREEYSKYVELNEKLLSLNKELKSCEYNIQLRSSELQNLQSKYTQYTEIRKELKKFRKIYDVSTYVKRAESAKEGMPLMQMKKYLGNTIDITNELLNLAYHGDRYLDDFDIGPSEFRIPFFNRGTRLSDVKLASQGEMSFLSVALSFALASQSLDKYNIMLLDEVDGALDDEKRSIFIDILNNQIERVHSEQSFLITHNDMFSSYPVDIVDFSFKNDTKEYPLANFIKIKRVA